MNSERRHELQQNALADYLGQWVKRIEPYTKQIAIAFVAIIVAVVAWGLYQNSAMMARSDATLELLQNASSSDAEALAAVSDRYPEAPAGLMARLFEADANLGAGVAVLYTDREDAESRIEDAIGAYREVTTSTKDRLLSSRAHYGLGQAWESLGKTDDAVSAYRQVVTLNESEAIVNAAQLRMDLLLKPETEEFLAWFAKQDFKPADPAAPPALPGSAQLPDLPDLDLPEIAPMEVPGELKGSPADETKSAPGEIMLPDADPVTADPPAAESPAVTEPAQSPQPTPATDAVPDPESTPSRQSEGAPDSPTTPVDADGPTEQDTDSPE